MYGAFFDITQTVKIPASAGDSGVWTDVGEDEDERGGPTGLVRVRDGSLCQIVV